MKSRNNLKQATPFYYKRILFFALLVCTIAACKKFLPVERETVGADSQFVIGSYQPVLGRTSFFSGNFFKGSTTYPSDFKIINPRRRNGDPAPELTDLFPVKVWKQSYTGTETTLQQIEDKREIQYRPIFEIGPHSGAFTLWAEGSSRFLRPQPDSGYLFDVELSNSGGRRFYRDLKLMPYRERPYEPSNFDVISGQPLSNGVGASVISNIKGVTSGRYLGGNDVEVYIRKLNTGATIGNSISFRFLDTLFNPINPDFFATTNWAELVHGFDMQKTATEVTYKVAFPIPLIEMPTKYTSGDGKRARVRFGYSRIGFGNQREEAVLGLDFALYEAGQWEIVFAFTRDNPKFIND